MRRRSAKSFRAVAWSSALALSLVCGSAGVASANTGASSRMTANKASIVSGARTTIWNSFNAEIRLTWVGQTDTYRGFYWSPSQGRWYPSTHGAQTVSSEHAAPNPIISGLRAGSQVVVGELNTYNRPVEISGAISSD